jgi:hypothetical protein
MLELSRPPHRDHGSGSFLGIETVSALTSRIRVVLEHDQRGCAGRMGRREQRPRRERAVDCAVVAASGLNPVRFDGGDISPRDGFPTPLASNAETHSLPGDYVAVTELGT